MDHRERFFRTVAREQVDRPASWLGLPVPESLPGIFSYFIEDTLPELKQALDDDIYPIELPYSSPAGNAIYAALNFKKSEYKTDDRTLTSPGFFEDYSDPELVDEFDWPNPEKYIDRDQCRAAFNSVPGDCARLGVVWSAHFQDALAAFGMETAMVKMITEPGMFLAVINRITDFYLKANELFYDAAGDSLDAVLIGNDFGSQQGLLVSPELLRRYVFPDTLRLIQQAHSRGYLVIHHSCGSIFPVIKDLIDLGVDVIHPIQALARDMDAVNMKNHFGSMVSFCGGIDAQELLIRGTPAEVFTRVQELKSVFPTGLIFSPSHEAILPDIQPANIEAVFKSLKQ